MSEPSLGSAPPPKPPPLWLLWGFLALQLLLPLHYYLLRESPLDERFAWRMFSAERMTRCQPEYLLDGEEVRLERRFHAAWITLLKRGRPGVVEAVSDRLCEEGEELRLRMVCRGPSQQRWVLEDGQRDLCEVTGP